MTATAQKTAEPLRLTLNQAAAMLNIHYETLRKLMYRRLFTEVRPNGKGIGKRVYLMPDEVNIYALEGERALREFRSRTGRLKRRPV